MLKQRVRPVRVLQLLLVLLALVALPWLDGSARSAAGAYSETTLAPPSGRPALGVYASSTPPPALTIDPYIRPDLARRMEQLRPTILAAAARHNMPLLSGMSDGEFAEVMTLIIYNEHNGWLEDDFEAFRAVTPLYQDFQQWTNASGMGSNFSVWPANLRPSVALEILRRQVPVPGPTRMITVPVTVNGSQIVPEDFESKNELFAAITAEISDDDLAVEYLAANLARGLFRAEFEGVPVTWRTLAAWHNQGIVSPGQILANPTASDYVRRASAYLPAARRFITMPPERPAERRERME
ncbi:MAG: hypothetical protein MUD01_09785 [Chloroflexaceae bacterium]|jgi:hypothetical protein|nr:hypothetical protein [Chloroflexaceae bacterium]